MNSLPEKSKCEILKQLNKKSEKTVCAALSQAVMENVPFPDPLEELLVDLKKAYQLHKDANGDQFGPLIEAIVEKTIYSKFKVLISQNTSSVNFPSSFLRFLAQKLSLTLPTSTLVQVGLQNGKIFWRVVEDDKVIHDHQKEKCNSQNSLFKDNAITSFQYHESNSVHLTWEQFHVLKNTGKRYGNVKITKENFVNYFNDEWKHAAEVVWNELKKTDIAVIDDKDRLSVKWRMMDRHLILKSIFTDVTLTNILSELFPQNSKNLSEKLFLSLCKKSCTWPTYSADKIFQKLWDNKVIQPSKVKVTWTLFRPYIDEHRLTYGDIQQAINTIAKNEEFAEKIDNQRLFRPDRSVKSWANTGYVQNSDPTSEANCVKLWDVSHYGDLNNHRWTGTSNSKLNFDHVPSEDALNRFSKGKCEGSVGFAIAIPESLHKHGVTYQLCSKDQAVKISTPFVQEFQCYVQKLTERPADYGFPENDKSCVFSLIASFRHLYRTQVKDPKSMQSQFFTEMIEVDIDELILIEIRKILPYL